MFIVDRNIICWISAVENWIFRNWVPIFYLEPEPGNSVPVPMGQVPSFNRNRVGSKLFSNRITDPDPVPKKFGFCKM